MANDDHWRKMSHEARRYGEQKFKSFAEKRGYLYDRESERYWVCAVRRGIKRTICEVLPVHRLTDESNKKAEWVEDADGENGGWVEFGWLIALPRGICYRPKKSNFKIYPLARCC